MREIVSDILLSLCYFCIFKQKTAYEMRISDLSSDVCSSDLHKGDVVADMPITALSDEAPVYERPFEVPQPTGEAQPKHDASRKILLSLKAIRSEERRVGKECVSTSRYRWAAFH